MQLTIPPLPLCAGWPYRAPWRLSVCRRCLPPCMLYAAAGLPVGTATSPAHMSHDGPHRTPAAAAGWVAGPIVLILFCGFSLLSSELLLKVYDV